MGGVEGKDRGFENEEEMVEEEERDDGDVEVDEGR